MSGTDKLSPRPMDNLSDSPSYIAPDAIHPDVDGTHIKGIDPAHPELAADHWAAKLTKIADAEQPGGDYTSVGHDSSAPGVIEDAAPAGNWPSSQLHSGIDAEK